MKQDFIEAVEAGDVRTVRLFLSNELLLDPRGGSFQEMYNYVESKFDNLFQANEESDYITPPQEEWDEDFLYKVKDDLDMNFSIEKLAFYQAVIEKVLQDKINELNQSDNESNNISSEEKTNTKVSPTSITVTTGGAVLTILGLCLGKTLLTISGAAVVIGGALLILKDVKK